MEIKLALPGAAVHQFGRQLEHSFEGLDPTQYAFDFPAYRHHHENDFKEYSLSGRYACTVICPENYLEHLLYHYEQAYAHACYVMSERQFERAQREDFKQRTDLEQFVGFCKNINSFDLREAAQKNEMIIHDLKRIIPDALARLHELAQAADLATPFEGAVKPYKTKEGDTLLFTFERKAEHKGRRLVIGRLAEVKDAKTEEEHPRISLDYAWLFNLVWEAGVTYAVTNTGLREGRRRKDPAYWSFEVKPVEELLKDL